MIDYGLKNKVAIITGANNPKGNRWISRIKKKEKLSEK